MNPKAATSEGAIDADALGERLRARSVDRAERRLLLTDFRGSDQEADLSVPPNCGGVGRIRHFRRSPALGWIPNPLPLDPACHALGLAPTELLRAQVFQNAACNWRCWYCFVPFELLNADPRHGLWRSPQELVAAYLAEPDRPRVLDLTGGQPDLVPEWVLWMMDALEDAGLAEEVYLWSDDALSTDFFWTALSEQDRARIARWPLYGRVCCFKGYDAASFAFNTKAAPDLFDIQFERMRRLLALGLDLYAYVTFTTPTTEALAERMARFVDRLQALDPMLPLRTVPLQVGVFTPVRPRLTLVREAALTHQQAALECFQSELERRYTAEERALNIATVPLGSRRGRS